MNHSIRLIWQKNTPLKPVLGYFQVSPLIVLTFNRWSTRLWWSSLPITATQKAHQGSPNWGRWILLGWYWEKEEILSLSFHSINYGCPLVIVLRGTVMMGGNKQTSMYWWFVLNLPSWASFKSIRSIVKFARPRFKDDLNTETYTVLDTTNIRERKINSWKKKRWKENFIGKNYIIQRP